MSLQIIGIYAAGIAILLGAIFALIGAWGLVRFDKVMPRMHAPSLISTLGIGALLLGSSVYSYATSDGSLHELLILAFLFVTAPVSAMFIAKVHIHRGAADRPPAPPQDETWATLDVPEDEGVRPAEGA